MISQYLLSQQSIKVTRSKNPNFHDTQLHKVVDSGVRMLWPPYFAHWLSEQWNKLWCSPKVVYLLRKKSRADLMNVVRIWTVFFNGANNSTEPRGNVPWA